MAGLRLTTKVQVSGWRFLLRRVEHAIVRRDTRMFDDPLQFYSRAVGAGIAVAVLISLGAVALAYFKPLGKQGADQLVVDRATNQLYLQLPGSGQLRPVYNLTSARLVLGSSNEPAVVKSEELNKYPKGQPIGIPGAPYATPLGTPASRWSLCDTVTNPDSVAPEIEKSILIRSLVTDSGVGPLHSDEGMLVTFKGNNWLVTENGRHAIDLADRAISSAVGIPVTAKATPVTEGLFNALPNMGPWQLPQIGGAGAPNTVGLPPKLVIGSVFQTATAGEPQRYVVLADGVARVNETTAAALRATNSYGLLEPPQVEASVVSAIQEQVYVSPLPDKPLKILLRQDEPVLCWSWQREPGDQAPKITVIAGRRLPIPASAIGTGVRQIAKDATVYIDGGQFIQLQSPDPKTGESMYYIDPQGVRYGIADVDAAKNLQLSAPVNAPWSVVSLLVEGPVLSKAAALLEHDTLPADPKPRKVNEKDGS